jgi:hypothetical protein
MKKTDNVKRTPRVAAPFESLAFSGAAAQVKREQAQFHKMLTAYKAPTAVLHTDKGR